MDEAVAPQLTIGIIRQLKAQGLNHSEIAREWGVTRAAVSYLWRKYDGTPTIRQRVAEVLPFNVPERFNRAQPLILLRDHAEYMIAGNVDRFSARRLSKLRSFYKKLKDEDLVVEYDPNIPSDPGVCKPGGFAYRPREPRDKGLMIRVNEYTNITEYGETIWKLPPRDI
ncbi:hypothetical protein [Mycobacteroides abscessus]